MVDRRNPYLVLGIPYGASRGEARRAAVLRTRELRDLSEPPYSQADVTWALHQVEQVIDDASNAVEVYRVPASPGVLDAPSGRGLFHPEPKPMARRSESLSDAEYGEVRHQAIRAVAKEVVSILGPHVHCWPPEEEGSR